MHIVRAVTTLPEELRHPMHRFVAESTEIKREQLLYWNILDDETIQLLFHVEGDKDAYAKAAEEEASISSYEIVPLSEVSFYILVEGYWTDELRFFRSQLEQHEIVPIPPLELTNHGELRVTLVGRQDSIRGLVTQLPEEVNLRIEQFTRYEEPPEESKTTAFASAALTARQREAVSIARETGYYAVPREGGLEDVADELECAPSTASNLLRRAESAIMSQVV